MKSGWRMIQETVSTQVHQIKPRNAPFQTESLQIHLILRRSNQIYKLPELSLIRRLVEDVQEIGIVGFGAEVFLFLGARDVNARAPNDG